EYWCMIWHNNAVLF
nr:immunoglobulin light chain junction region [Macaca mulatta]